MAQNAPVDVARRCLALELLLQRLGLETDDEDPAPERDEVRRMWLSRLGDLGVDEVLTDAERALLERPVGALTEDDLDDVHGRASGALVLLWALGRIADKPTFATVDAMESIIVAHGLLGAGSISAANAAAVSAELRPDAELEGARAAYERKRGKAREPTEAEPIFAGVAAQHLAWVLDADAELDAG